MKSLLIILTVLICTNFLIIGTAASEEVDLHTKLLIQSETFDGDLEIVDSSPSNHFVFVNGNVFHSAQEAKFGETSLYFAGDGAYLELEDSDDWNFGAADFTIDFWINTREQYRTMFFTQGWGVRHNETSQSVLLDYFPGQDQLILGYRGQIDNYINRRYSPPSLNDGQWHHVAIVRHQNWLKVYCDGIETNRLDMTNDPVVADAVYPFLIGKYSLDANSANIDGFMEDFRISKGTALWTAEFTPPSLPTTPAPVNDFEDSDSDGIADSNDACPGTPPLLPVDADGCSACYSEAEVDQMLAEKNAIIEESDWLIEEMQNEIIQKDDDFAQCFEKVTNMYTQEQLDSAVAAARDAISTEFLQLLRSLFQDDSFNLPGQTLDAQLTFFINALKDMPQGQIKKLQRKLEQ